MKQGKSLGLELLARHLKPGEIPSHYLMAIWMNAAGEKITRQRLQQIEQRALKKCRIKWNENGNREMLELAIEGIRK